MAAIEMSERINEVHIEGLALLKIVKHCEESLPQMVTGSLLGLTVENNVLEITHAFPFPEPHSDKNKTFESAADDPQSHMDGHEFQLEMMKMLREVNVDNNCVGWYQTMYLGSYSTSSLVENQLSYQTDLSPNAVVLLYDPIQTAHGNLVLKCFRLTEECVRFKASGKNGYMDPSKIFDELPVKLVNPGLSRAFLYDIADGRQPDDREPDRKCAFDRLDLGNDSYLEKHLEFLSTWVDDLAAEQHKFQYYMRNLTRGSGKDRYDKGRKNVSLDPKVLEDGWASGEAPKRMESLLISNQISSYCDQMDRFTEGGFGKLFLAGGLNRKEKN